MNYPSPPFTREQLSNLYENKVLRPVRVASILLLDNDWPSYIGFSGTPNPSSSETYHAFARRLNIPADLHMNMFVLQQGENIILLDGYDVYGALGNYKNASAKEVYMWMIPCRSVIDSFRIFQLAIYVTLRRVEIMESLETRHFAKYIKMLTLLGFANERTSQHGPEDNFPRLYGAISTLDETLTTHSLVRFTRLVSDLMRNFLYMEFIEMYHDDILRLSESKRNFFIARNLETTCIHFVFGAWWNEQSIYSQQLYTILVLSFQGNLMNHERCEQLRDRILRIFRDATTLMENMSMHLRPLSLQALLLAEFHSSDMLSRPEYPRARYYRAAKLTDTILFHIGRAMSNEIIKKVCDLQVEVDYISRALHVEFDADWTKAEFNDLRDACLNHVRSVMLVSRVLHVPTVIRNTILP